MVSVWNLCVRWRKGPRDAREPSFCTDADGPCRIKFMFWSSSFVAPTDPQVGHMLCLFPSHASMLSIIGSPRRSVSNQVQQLQEVRQWQAHVLELRTLCRSCWGLAEAGSLQASIPFGRSFLSISSQLDTCFLASKKCTVRLGTGWLASCWHVSHFKFEIIYIYVYIFLMSKRYVYTKMYIYIYTFTFLYKYKYNSIYIYVTILFRWWS